MLKRRRRLQKAAVQRGACRASGMGREGCRGRRGNYLSLARFLLPASFQASVPQQLSEEKTNKSEKETGRRRRRAATREHLSSRPIFRNTLCANYTIKSLRQRCEGKKAPAAKTEKKKKTTTKSCRSFCCSSPWAASLPPPPPLPLPHGLVSHRAGLTS